MEGPSIAERRGTAAYVGILTPGSTSLMRAEWLRKLTPELDWTWIDTDAPMVSTSRVWQSLAFRLHIGKAVDAINEEVMRGLGDRALDLAWVDKAVFLERKTIARLRQLSGRLVHFTPDTAFGANSSRHFEAGLSEYDVVVTTKSFELPEYQRRISADRVHLTTQGFDPTVHYPRFTDSARKKSAAFVGLAEPDRERCVTQLLESGVSVRLAGRGWSGFLKNWGAHPKLAFEGEECFGDDYAILLSESWIGLGLLSKRFPELHTTRTFEIPACGAILATERTAETNRFFDDSEVIFFDDYSDLADSVVAAFALEEPQLAARARAGLTRVVEDDRDYPAILTNILRRFVPG